MKRTLLAALSILLLQSCNNSSKESGKEPEKASPKTEEKFFPVTAYIKGQIFEINKKQVNPLKCTTIKNHTDSVWVQTEEFNNTFKEFLQPEIDSTNLISLFTESKFLDQSINAYTFTYDPRNKLPDSITLKHWDVYVDPQTGNVKRIYMVKNAGANKTLQLTWISNKWCKISTIVDTPGGISTVEKEEKISWDF